MLSMGVTQERVATPSICTVQAPQSAMPQSAARLPGSRPHLWCTASAAGSSRVFPLLQSDATPAAADVAGHCDPHQQRAIAAPQRQTCRCSVGLLGGDYPGYFAVGDTAALTRLLHRIETDPKFLMRLRRATARRAHLFRPAREKAAWKRLIAEVMPKSQANRPTSPTTNGLMHRSKTHHSNPDQRGADGLRHGGRDPDRNA